MRRRARQLAAGAGAVLLLSPVMVLAALGAGDRAEEIHARLEFEHGR